MMITNISVHCGFAHEMQTESSVMAYTKSLPKSHLFVFFHFPGTGKIINNV